MFEKIVVFKALGPNNYAERCGSQNCKKAVFRKRGERYSILPVDVEITLCSECAEKYVISGN